MSYFRVLPRDLFNEAKLLKCLGRLTLACIDDLAGRLEFEHDGEAFDIHQDELSGELYVSNLHFTIGERVIIFRSPYNSRLNYPLVFKYEDESDDYVFQDNGEFTPAFKAQIL